MEQALQWWHNQRAEQLNSEAIQIRDRLLQESFAFRRSLELSQLQSDQLLNYTDCTWIRRFEIFHYHLKELSDRLCPPYLEEGLPLAIEYLIEKWKIAHPYCEFQWKFTPKSQQNLSQRNRIILTMLDELFLIEIAKCTNKELVVIDLVQNKEDNQLKITIQLSQHSESSSSDNHRELKYLQESFRVLASGTWKTETSNLSKTHHLRWFNQSS